MATRYDENTKARAVRLVREHVGDDYETEWAAMKAISARLGRRDVTQVGAPGRDRRR